MAVASRYFQPRKGTSFPASPKKALGNPPTATTTSSSRTMISNSLERLHSRVKRDARFEAPSAPDTHHVDDAVRPSPAQTCRKQHGRRFSLCHAFAKEEEKIAAASRQDRERGWYRSSGRDSSPTSGRRGGRLAVMDRCTPVDVRPTRTDGNAYLRPVRKMKVSSSAKKSGPKTSENCCVHTHTHHHYSSSSRTRRVYFTPPSSTPTRILVFIQKRHISFFFFEGEKRPRREIRSSSRQKTARVSLFSCLRDHQKSNHFRPNRDRDENRHVVLGFSDDWRAKRRRDDETRVHRASSFLLRFSLCPLSLLKRINAPPRSADSSVRWN